MRRKVERALKALLKPRPSKLSFIDELEIAQLEECETDRVARSNNRALKHAGIKLFEALTYLNSQDLLLRPEVSFRATKDNLWHFVQCSEAQHEFKEVPLKELQGKYCERCVFELGRNLVSYREVLKESSTVKYKTCDASEIVIFAELIKLYNQSTGNGLGDFINLSAVLRILVEQPNLFQIKGFFWLAWLEKTPKYYEVEAKILSMTEAEFGKLFCCYSEKEYLQHFGLWKGGEGGKVLLEVDTQSWRRVASNGNPIILEGDFKPFIHALATKLFLSRIDAAREEPSSKSGTLYQLYPETVDFIKSNGVKVLRSKDVKSEGFDTFIVLLKGNLKNDSDDPWGQALRSEQALR